MTPVYEKDPTSAAKYAQARYWVLLNTLRAAETGLHTSTGLRILDIGSGPGFFLAIGRALGHECYGVEAPDACLTDVERDVYLTLTTTLHCNGVVTPLWIERFQTMPFRDRPFDLITSFWVCFNRHRRSDEWSAEEWQFFIQDAMACLRPGGRIIMELNENSERYGDLGFYDADTLAYFRSLGSVKGGRIELVRP